MYEHNVKYYETDQMAVAHHSNYIRWMEEARMDFLTQSGFDCAAMERAGFVMPIVSVECSYARMTRFNETVSISVRVEEYNGVKVKLGYEITDKAGGGLRARGRSVNCFMKDGVVKPLKKICAELDERLKTLTSKA